MPDETTPSNNTPQPQTQAEPSAIDKANETLKQIQEAEKRVAEKMQEIKETEQRVSNAILAGRANAGQVPNQLKPEQIMADEITNAFFKKRK